MLKQRKINLTFTSPAIIQTVSVYRSLDIIRSTRKGQTVEITKADSITECIIKLPIYRMLLRSTPKQNVGSAKCTVDIPFSNHLILTHKLKHVTVDSLSPTRHPCVTVVCVSVRVHVTLLQYGADGRHKKTARLDCHMTVQTSNAPSQRAWLQLKHSNTTTAVLYNALNSD